MKKTYKKDYSHHYVILSGGRETDHDSYRVRILLTNQIPTLLETKLEQIDRNELFYYEVTGQQPLSECWKLQPVGENLLILLLQSIGKTLEELKNYLLGPDGLQMDPELIYLSPKHENMHFCYYPGSEQNFREQLRKMAETMLTRLDHRDREAVALGYAFYQKCMDEDVTADMIANLLHRGDWEDKTERGALKEKPVFPYGERRTETGGSGRTAPQTGVRESLSVRKNSSSDSRRLNKREKGRKGRTGKKQRRSGEKEARQFVDSVDPERAMEDPRQYGSLGRMTQEEQANLKGRKRKGKRPRILPERNAAAGENRQYVRPDSRAEEPWDRSFRSKAKEYSADRNG